jgi:Zn-dependent peptidase ImmA (M78 family)
MSIVYQSESDSRKLLESSWWLNPKKNYPLPVDPVILAVKLGIKVKISFLPSDVSGETSIPYMGNPEISLNKNDELTRNRFACAHGIGHYIHSRNSTNFDLLFVDYRSTLMNLDNTPEEVYCNQFASALLMPAHIVQSFWKEYVSLDNMAKIFGTSVKALESRLLNLNLSRIGPPQ